MAHLSDNGHDIVPFGGRALPDCGAILELHIGSSVFGDILRGKLGDLTGSSFTDSRGRSRLEEDEETVESGEVADQVESSGEHR